MIKDQEKITQALESQVRQQEILIDMKDEIIRDRGRIIENLEKNRQRE